MAQYGIDLAGAVVIAAALDAFTEPLRVRFTEYRVRLPGWPPALSGLNILHLSDLHGRTTAFAHPRFLEWLDAADLVAVTGDLYSPTIPRRRLVRRLNDLDPARTLFVSGNHDYRRGRLHIAPWVPPEAVILDNRVVERTRGGVRYQVAGLPDLRRGRPDWSRVTVAGDAPAILLAHRPDVVLNEAARKFNLVLTGHTHGGQVRMVGIGAIIKHSALPRSQVYGLSWPRAHQALVVSGGLGTSELPVRFLNLPEVVRVVLETGPAGDSSLSRQANPG